MNGIKIMKNLENIEKFRGVLLFAFNTAEVNYVEIANRAAILIKKYINLPVTLVTDSNAGINDLFDNIIITENCSDNKRYNLDRKIEQWRNTGRHRAYELSPYLETLVIDADYLQFDNSLLKLFEQPFDYRLQYKMRTPVNLNTDNMGPISLPLVWATVFLFRKTSRAKQFFELVNRIEKNYVYYRNIFGITFANYRNDFAFSIANVILNGYTLTPYNSIPWPMITIENKIKSISFKNKFLCIKTDSTADLIYQQNLHIMDKEYLLSDEFANFLADINYA